MASLASLDQIYISGQNEVNIAGWKSHIIVTH